MKKIKLLIIFLILLLMAGCGYNAPAENLTPNAPTRLQTPVVNVENGIISWVRVINAEKYEIKINNNIFYTEETTYPIEYSNKPVEYSIQIKTIGNGKEYLDSLYSENIITTCYQLQKPANFKYKVAGLDVKVEWYQVECDYYVLSVNDIETVVLEQKQEGNQITINRSYTIPNSAFVTGKNNLSIRAASNQKNTIDSDCATLTATKNPPYADIKIENGSVIDDFGKLHFFTGSGYYNQKFYNFKDGNIPSNATQFAFFRVIEPQIEEITKTILPQVEGHYIEKIHIKIRNFDPRYVGGDHKILGYDYDRITIKAYDRWDREYLVSQRFGMYPEYNEFIFMFPVYFTGGTVHKVEIQLHKTGAVSSNTLTHSFK